MPASKIAHQVVVPVGCPIPGTGDWSCGNDMPTSGWGGTISWSYKPFDLFFAVPDTERTEYLAADKCPHCFAELIVLVELSFVKKRKPDLGKYISSISLFQQDKGLQHHLMLGVSATHKLNFDQKGQRSNRTFEYGGAKRKRVEVYDLQHPENFDRTGAVLALPQAEQIIGSITDDEMAILLTEKPREALRVLATHEAGPHRLSAAFDRTRKAPLQSVFSLNPRPSDNELFSAVVRNIEFENDFPLVEALEKPLLEKVRQFLMCSIIVFCLAAIYFSFGMLRIRGLDDILACVGFLAWISAIVTPWPVLFFFGGGRKFQDL